VFRSGPECVTNSRLQKCSVIKLKGIKRCENVEGFHVFLIVSGLRTNFPQKEVCNRSFF
jgi:hypothetical protein